jgi:hypothetical protein
LGALPLDSAAEPSRHWACVDATYRADLRELTELNFARFDAKLEQRLAELGAAVRTEFAQGLSQMKGELVKWMFAFWAPTGLAVLSLLLRD